MNSDRYYEANSNSANNTSLNHTIEIIRAASPYISGINKSSLDLFIKVGELFDTITRVKNNTNVSAQSMSPLSFDMEGLLSNIRNICYEKERKIIDMILNVFKMKKMFETYSIMSQFMSPNNASEGFSNFMNFNGNTTSNNSNTSSNNQANNHVSNFDSGNFDVDDLLKQLANLQSPSSDSNEDTSMNEQTSSSDIIFTSDDPFETEPDFNFEDNYTTNDYYTYNNHSTTNSDQSASQTHSHSNNKQTNTSSSSSTTNSNNNSTNNGLNPNNMELMMKLMQSMSNNNTSNNGNANMSQMLETFLTPEQKTTFETLSTLMNTM